jgi:hypothetical protein
MLQIPPEFEALIQLKAQLFEARKLCWRSTLFCLQWWLSVLIPLCLICLWLKVVKRSLLAEIVVYGLLWATTATALDYAGTELILWEYPYTIVPMGSKNLSANLTSIPVAFMLVYQYYPTTKAFLQATVAISLIFAFVFEPVLVWLGIYKLYYWQYYYSFSLYVLFSLIFRWITKKVFAIQSRHRK